MKFYIATRTRTVAELLDEGTQLTTELLAAETPEEEEAVIDRWMQLEGEAAEKIERIYFRLRRLGEERSSLQKEEARLAARRKRVAKAEERMDQLARTLLEMVPGRALSTVRMSARLARNGGKPALVILGEAPPEYTIQITTEHPDRDRIRDELERGVTLDFARLERGEHVRWS